MSVFSLTNAAQRRRGFGLGLATVTVRPHTQVSTRTTMIGSASNSLRSAQSKSVRTNKRPMAIGAFANLPRKPRLAHALAPAPEAPEQTE